MARSDFFEGLAALGCTALGALAGFTLASAYGTQNGPSAGDYLSFAGALIGVLGAFASALGVIWIERRNARARNFQALGAMLIMVKAILVRDTDETELQGPADPSVIVRISDRIANTISSSQGRISALMAVAGNGDRGIMVTIIALETIFINNGTAISAIRKCLELDMPEEAMIGLRSSYTTVVTFIDANIAMIESRYGKLTARAHI